VSSRGLFITLEGGDGAGKSLQLDALAGRLEERGYAVVRTREPGGTPLGERLRDVLLDLGEGGCALDPLSETLLFVAARAELVASVIAPALERGEVVVCDRFIDSTRAYQGFGRGVDPTAIGQLNAVATRGLLPDLTVLLDLPPEQGLARATEIGDRFGREDDAFHERVREGYRALALEEADRWLVVDSTPPPEVVLELIWRRVEVLLTTAG
jgi:dTMP kinase